MNRQSARQSRVFFVTSWLLLVCALVQQDLLATELKAESPVPANGFGTADPSSVLLRWTPAQQASEQHLYLSTGVPPTDADRITTLSRTTSSYFNSLGFELGQTYYWRIDITDFSGTLHSGFTWTFTTLSYQAGVPNPSSNTQWVTPGNATLSWQSGLLAVSHDIFFGSNEESVRVGLSSVYHGLIVGTGQLQFPLPPLEKGTTYYWRIDERQSSGLITQGDTWQFTTLGSDGGIQGRYFDNTYLGEMPVLTRVDDHINLNFTQDNQLNRVLSSNQFSVRWTGQIFLPTSQNTTLSVIANDCVRLWVDGQVVMNDWIPHPTRQLSVTVPPNLNTPTQIVLEYAHIQGDPHIQLLWSHGLQTPKIIPNGPLQPNTRSHSPTPGNANSDISQSPRLSWNAGTTVITHNLYLGTNRISVRLATPHDPEFLVQQNTASYDLPPLDLNQTYYWRVDDVNSFNQPNVATGQVWQFTTSDYVTLEDFESYANLPPQRIFVAWLDGWGYSQPYPAQPGNNTGATVGHMDRPYAEQRIVHAGKQSMPLAYNNSGAYQNSETKHGFASPLDMTSQNNQSLNTLSLAFHGQPDAVGQFSRQQNTFNLTGSGTGFWEENDRCYFVSQSVSGSATISACVDHIETIHALSQAGIMIRQSHESNAPQTCVAITADGRLVCHYRSSLGQPVTSLYSEPGTVTLPHWIKLQREGAILSLSHSQNGFSWSPVTLDNQPAMSLSGFASLGLMHCVYADNYTPGTAVFSQVSSSSVAPFTTESSLGIPLNEADDLYLVLEDTQGESLLIPHPDNPLAVLHSDWKTWNIDLSSYPNINLRSIQAISIGIGGLDQQTSGGQGLLFIDDIGLHP